VVVGGEVVIGLDRGRAPHALTDPPRPIHPSEDPTRGLVLHAPATERRKARSQVHPLHPCLCTDVCTLVLLGGRCCCQIYFMLVLSCTSMPCARKTNVLAWMFPTSVALIFKISWDEKDSKHFITGFLFRSAFTYTISHLVAKNIIAICFIFYFIRCSICWFCFESGLLLF